MLPAPGASDIYDFEDRLIVRTRSDLSKVYLGYDADGIRVRKTILNASSQLESATSYLVCTNNLTGYAQVLEERTTSAADTTLKTYAYGHDLLSVTTRAPGSSLPAPCAYYLYDGGGSVRALADESGAITDRYTYDAFGVLISSPAQGDLAAATYLYRGEQYDADLGLYYLRARFYNQDSGRFWNQDTYEGRNTDPASLHKYLYAHADPVNNWDPSGHWSASQTLLTIGVWGYLHSMAIVKVAGTVALAATAVYVWTGNVISYEEHFGDGASEELYALRTASAQVFFISFGAFDVGVAMMPVRGGGGSVRPQKTVYISRSRYPESARHVEDAQRAGHPVVLTVDRTGAAARRAKSLAQTARVAGFDRDEYPPAVSAEGGSGASVRLIPPADNRGAGSSMGHQLKDVPDGGTIEVRTSE